MTKLATDPHRQAQTILTQDGLKVGSILNEFIGYDVFCYIFLSRAAG